MKSPDVRRLFAEVGEHGGADGGDGEPRGTHEGP